MWNGGFILIKKEEYKLPDHFSELDVLDEDPCGSAAVYASSVEILNQQTQTDIDIVRQGQNDVYVYGSRITRSPRQGHQGKGQDARNRPYRNKQQRIVLIVKYLHYHGPSNENEIRRNGLNGGNHREIHNDLLRLYERGFITPTHHRSYELTKDGETIFSTILNEDKSTLELLDLPTMLDSEVQRE